MDYPLFMASTMHLAPNPPPLGFIIVCVSLSSAVLFSSVYVGVHLAINVSYHMQKHCHDIRNYCA